MVGPGALLTDHADLLTYESDALVHLHATPGAVVDQYCRVRGVQNLRVVDASVMPNIVSCNTNLTCIMLAERISRWLTSDE